MIDKESRVELSKATNLFRVWEFLGEPLSDIARWG